ncbi:MAG: hypothetical protein ACTHMU_16700 [Thermomicrobiales bacterium]
MLATDGSPAADEGGRAAIVLAQQTRAALHVVLAWRMPPEHADPALDPEDRAAITAMREELGGTNSPGRLISEAGRYGDLEPGPPGAARPPGCALDYVLCRRTHPRQH